MPGKIVSLRLPENLFKKLEVARGERSRNSFVSDILSAQLGLSPESEEPVPDRQIEPKPEESKTYTPVPRRDDELLLKYISDRSVSLRWARQDLDWPEIRVERAANKLLNAGLIKFVGSGMLERV